ncbi:MAG: M56 family metallopeptidase [Bacteroidota bacterium]
MDLTTTLLPYATAFGLAILHSLWIGALLYTSVRALLPLLPGPVARHHLAYGALLLLAGGFAAAFYLNYDASPACENLAAVAILPFSGTELQLPVLAVAPELSWTEWLQQSLPDLAPWLSLAYLVGLLPAAVLLLRDQERVWELRRNGLSALPASWAVSLGEELARHPATRRVKCYLSARAGEVMTLGFWHPVVVFPVALVNELTPEMARTILLHELAHLRHYDHWLNYPQQILRTFFFYHPAAYALCQLIDREREHRCDDYVTGCCGDRRTYATALVTVARSSHIPPNNLVMSATKTPFSSRIQRLFIGDDRRKDGRFAFSVLLVLLIGAGHLSFTYLGADASAGDCLGEQKTTLAAPVITETPAPKPCSPIPPCSDAPQPPASDNVQALAAYERAVERYVEVQEKISSTRQERRARAITPIAALPVTQVKKPCPQRRALPQVRVDTLPPAKSDQIKISPSGTDIAFYIDGVRLEPGMGLDVIAPKDIKAISVFKTEEEFAVRNLVGYNGIIDITTKDGNWSASLLKQDKHLTFDKMANNVFYVNDKKTSLRKVRKIMVKNVERIASFKGPEQAAKFGHPNKDGVVKIYLKQE